MNSTDFRDAEFEALREGLEASRKIVYEGWERFGPCTTRQLAGHIGMDILTVRPRTTELIQMGLLCVAGGCRGGKEGVYRARTKGEWNGFKGDVLTVMGTRTQLQLI